MLFCMISVAPGVYSICLFSTSKLNTIFMFRDVEASLWEITEPEDISIVNLCEVVHGVSTSPAESSIDTNSSGSLKVVAPSRRW